MKYEIENNQERVIILNDDKSLQAIISKTNESGAASEASSELESKSHCWAIWRSSTGWMKCATLSLALSLAVEPRSLEERSREAELETTHYELANK